MKNEKNTWKSITVIAVVLSVLAIGMVGAASAKSLYVIANHHQAQFDAYKINPDGTVAYQINYTLTVSTAPGGLAIDDDSATLFVTSEGSNNVELVDARTMKSLGFATAPGASNLAGIDVDNASNIVYTINRRTDDLYAYDWNSAAQTLTLKAGYPVNLPNCQGAYGIALNRTSGILYVADTLGNKVRGYNVTWAEVQTFTPSQLPVGIAVDKQRGFIYTTAPDGGCAGSISGSNLLVKIDIATGAETNESLGDHGGMGIAVDCATGLVYVTGGCSGDDISVWNTTTSPFTQVQTTGDIGAPCGICIPQAEIEYRPPAPAVPTLTPIGLIVLVGLLSVIAAMSIKIRKRRG